MLLGYLGGGLGDLSSISLTFFRADPTSCQHNDKKTPPSHACADPAHRRNKSSTTKPLFLHDMVHAKMEYQRPSRPCADPAHRLSHNAPPPSWHAPTQRFAKTKTQLIRIFVLSSNICHGRTFRCAVSAHSLHHSQVRWYAIFCHRIQHTGQVRG